ncbi:MAG TPA: hypothetical protein VGP17_01845 [Solirubrobacteraceae bacterium]|jgi:4-aminobutyrate aminotransferase-like enzyme|nr:hypothetical protein [Solirubrobacteraceae bacterium]
MEAVDRADERATLEIPQIRRIVRRERELGIVLSQNGTSIEIAPPTVISREDLADGVSRFERAVREICS